MGQNNKTQPISLPITGMLSRVNGSSPTSSRAFQTSGPCLEHPQEVISQKL